MRHNGPVDKPQLCRGIYLVSNLKVLDTIEFIRQLADSAEGGTRLWCTTGPLAEIVKLRRAKPVNLRAEGIFANGGALAMCLCFHKNKNGKGIATNAMLALVKIGLIKNLNICHIQ